jgi:hypothetical protein
MCDDKTASQINAIPCSRHTGQKINVEIPANKLMKLWKK